MKNFDFKNRFILKLWKLQLMVEGYSEKLIFGVVLASLVCLAVLLFLAK